MPGSLENLLNHVHGATMHFPIALPFVSAGPVILALTGLLGGDLPSIGASG